MSGSTVVRGRLEQDLLLESAASRLREAGIELPRMEAELLLALAAGVNRLAVQIGLGDEDVHAAQDRFDHLLDQRLLRMPFAYLRGTQEFYGLDFVVTPDTLIPRPETELLVDFALERLEVGSNSVIADVCCGTGCIGIAVLSRRSAIKAFMTDVSNSALQIAQQNASRLNVLDRTCFVQGDLMDGIEPESLDGILSNPPYIPSSDLDGLQPEVSRHEPRLALDGGPSGLQYYGRLASEAQRCLKPGGWLAVEVGQGQAEIVMRMFQDAGLRNVNTRHDLAGIQRLVSGEKAQ